MLSSFQQIRHRYYPPPRSSSGVSCCVKYLVFSFNVIFWIVGLLMLAAGVWAQVEKNNPYSQLNRLSKFYLDPALMLIIIGATTFAIGFSGEYFLCSLVCVQRACLAFSAAGK